MFLLTVAAIAAVAAGCGASSDGTEGTQSTAPSASSTAPGAAEAPVGVRAKTCMAGEGAELRVTGVSCAFGRTVFAGWHKDSECFEPRGASRTSCKLGAFTCLGAVTDRGIAATCATAGRSIAFVAKAPR
jgi:hypothetical protein